MRDECWFCLDTRPDPPPGGWLIDDGVWRAGHAPASYSIAGTVIFEAHRHVRDQADFDERESATYVETLGRMLRAIEQATGCDRVYHWATMDAYAHFHLWLVPWWESADLRGPRHLVNSVVDGTGCSEADAEHTADQMRSALA